MIHLLAHWDSCPDVNKDKDSYTIHIRHVTCIKCVRVVERKLGLDSNETIQHQTN